MALKFKQLSGNPDYITFSVHYSDEGIEVPVKTYSVHLDALADGRTTIQAEKDKAEADALVRWQRLKTQLEVEI